MARHQKRRKKQKPRHQITEVVQRDLMLTSKIKYGHKFVEDGCNIILYLSTQTGKVFTLTYMRNQNVLDSRDKSVLTRDKAQSILVVFFGDAGINIHKTAIVRSDLNGN